MIYLRFNYLILICILIASLVFAGMPGTAVRTVASTYNPGSTLTVTVNVTPLEGTTTYGLDEKFPKEWTISKVMCTNVVTGAVCAPDQIFVLPREDTGEVFFTNLPNNDEMIFSYDLTPPKGYNSQVTLSGVFEYYVGQEKHFTYEVSGTSIISPPTAIVSAPIEQPVVANKNDSDSSFAVLVIVLLVCIVVVGLVFVTKSKKKKKSRRK